MTPYLRNGVWYNPLAILGALGVPRKARGYAPNPLSFCRGHHNLSTATGKSEAGAAFPTQKSSPTRQQISRPDSSEGAIQFLGRQRRTYLRGPRLVRPPLLLLRLLRPRPPPHRRERNNEGRQAGRGDGRWARNNLRSQSHTRSFRSIRSAAPRFHVKSARGFVLLHSGRVLDEKRETD